MIATTTEDHGLVRISLAGEFVETANKVFWRAMAGAKGWDVVIDLTNVTRIDGQGLAMLETAADMWKLDSRSLSIVCPKSPMKQTCLSSRIVTHLSILS